MNKASSLPLIMTSQSSHGTDHNEAQDQSIVVLPKLLSIEPDNSHETELSWLVNSQIPPDVSVQVEDMTFNVHKYPLISKCGYVRQLDIQQSKNAADNLKLENFPGGSDTFKIILKFCYGLPVDLTPENIAPLRCASEYLEMSEEIDEGNLISKTETFITFVVLSSWKDTITVLKSCETLSPWSENLQIVRRCCDSIAWKVSRDHSTDHEAVQADDLLRIDEVANLRIDQFLRIVAAIRARGTKQDVIGRCIMNYVENRFPIGSLELEGLRGYGYGKSELQLSLSRDEGDAAEGGNAAKEQRTVIESLISILPAQIDAVPCKFLLRMLRVAILCSVTPALISELEKRIGMVLYDATVNDLLIPCYKIGVDQAKTIDGYRGSSSEQSTMHDVDVVQRILEYFIMHEQQQQQMTMSGRYSNVSKLLDTYLVAVARDPNLSIIKFQVLADSLPEKVRACDDGLYRAIDTYFKRDQGVNLPLASEMDPIKVEFLTGLSTHPSLSEHDRKRLCKIMKCEKLSLDACMHAAQNDRLPLRTIIQVLFSEQLKMRSAMKGQEVGGSSSGNTSPNKAATDIEMKALRSELENVKVRMTELQTDYIELQREYEKLSGNSKQRRVSAMVISGWRKIKNSFHLKVEEADHDNNNPQQPVSPTTGRVGCKTSLRRRQSIS